MGVVAIGVEEADGEGLDAVAQRIGDPIAQRNSHLGFRVLLQTLVQSLKDALKS